jgi:Siphovirus-type tail component, C-terminal domain
MLTMVTVQNPSGTLFLPLTDASQGYVVKDIQGLDPVKASLASSTMAQMDGALFQNARREPRNILVKVGLECDYVTNTVAGLRKNLYDYLMTKGFVTFSLWVDLAKWTQTIAVVESVENNMFTTDPEVDISLICFDPDLYAPSETVLDGTTTNSSDTVTIDYPGTSETGVLFQMVLPADTSEVRLYNTRPDQDIDLVRVTGNMLANDLLTIDTNPGSKKVTITRNGLEFSILYFLDQTSDWVSLMRGPNLFRAFYGGAPSPYTLTYTVKYGGY